MNELDVDLYIYTVYPDRNGLDVLAIHMPKEGRWEGN